MNLKGISMNLIRPVQVPAGRTTSAVVGIILAVAALAGCSNESPAADPTSVEKPQTADAAIEDVVEQMTAAMASGDEAAYQSTQCPKKRSPTTVKTPPDVSNIFSKLRLAEVSKIVVDGDNATATAVFYYEGEPQKRREELSLVNDTESGWLVC
ncbi:hypothetical protein WKY82_08335 [Gordonia malaquae]|uniref:Rv0361 family membrane protein n=1 Tax=Gordonia malaquae TaxID=410332 RepID=UPI0030C797C2